MQGFLVFEKDSNQELVILNYKSPKHMFYW